MQPPVFSSTSSSIAWHAQHKPVATAIVEGATQVTYHDMAADLARCVQTLKDRGIASGMLVGIENRQQRYPHLLLLLACEAIGSATTSFSPQMLRGDDPVLLHCSALLLDKAPEAEDHLLAPALLCEWLDHLATMPVIHDHLGLLRQENRNEGTVSIVRTSGTTGKPKAIVTSHATQQRIITRRMDRLSSTIRANAKFLCLYGLNVRAIHLRALGILQQGGTVIFTREDQVHGLFGTGAANYAAVTVGDMERIIQRALPPLAGHDLYVELFGAAVSPHLRQLIQERLNARLRTSYSSNETHVVAETDDKNVGTILPNALVRIVDAAGHDVPIGETGLIRVKTDTMTDGYFHDPAQTAASFIDGWYLTNDMGYMPEPGRLVVLGRTDDMLNIGGVKLPPLPIEQALRFIAGISDAAVMSIERPNHVDRLLVALESDQPAANLIAPVSAILARHIRTFEILVLSRFPRTQTGKVQRQEIKAAFHPRPQTETSVELNL